MATVTHVKDVADELSLLDQRVYASLLGASDQEAVEELLEGRRAHLVDAQDDRVKLGTLQLRQTMLKHISKLPPAVYHRVAALLLCMLPVSVNVGGMYPANVGDILLGDGMGESTGVI